MLVAGVDEILGEFDAAFTAGRPDIRRAIEVARGRLAGVVEVVAVRLVLRSVEHVVARAGLAANIAIDADAVVGVAAD